MVIVIHDGFGNEIKPKTNGKSGGPGYTNPSKGYKTTSSVRSINPITEPKYQVSLTKEGDVYHFSAFLPNMDMVLNTDYGIHIVSHSKLVASILDTVKEPVNVKIDPDVMSELDLEGLTNISFNNLPR